MLQKNYNKMNTPSHRLDALRERLTVSWTELAELLGVSRSMLNYVRTGGRAPGPRLLRRITELESLPPGASLTRMTTKRQHDTAASLAAEPRERYQCNDLDALAELLSDAQARTAAALQIVLGRIRDEQQRDADGK